MPISDIFFLKSMLRIFRKKADRQHFIKKDQRIYVLQPRISILILVRTALLLPPTLTYKLHAA